MHEMQGLVTKLMLTKCHFKSQRQNGLCLYNSKTEACPPMPWRSRHSIMPKSGAWGRKQRRKRFSAKSAPYLTSSAVIDSQAWKLARQAWPMRPITQIPSFRLHLWRIPTDGPRGLIIIIITTFYVLLCAIFCFKDGETNGGDFLTAWQPLRLHVASFPPRRNVEASFF